jgi:hypothetical protein
MSETAIKRALIAERGNVVRAAARLLRNEVKASVGVTQTIDGKYQFPLDVYKADRRDNYNLVWQPFIILPTDSPTESQVENAIKKMIQHSQLMPPDQFLTFDWGTIAAEEYYPFDERYIPKMGNHLPKGFVAFNAWIGTPLQLEEPIPVPPAPGSPPG